MDWDGPNALDIEESVEVPDTECREELEELQHVVPPLSLSTHYGIDKV